MAAPTNVDTYSSGYASRSWPTGATVTGVTVDVGDVLICKGGLEQGGVTLNTPTGGTGLTWTLRNTPSTASDRAPVYLWTAVATAAFTGQTITVTGSSGTLWGGVVIRRWSGSDGIGAAAEADNGTGSGLPSVGLTTTGANSAVDVITADWNAVDGATRAYTTVNVAATEVTYARDAAAGTAYGWYYSDAGAAGAKTVGITTPTGQRYHIAAVEILGSSGGGGDAYPVVRVAPAQAAHRAATW